MTEKLLTGTLSLNTTKYYHDLHCLPFFLSSFIKVYTVCHFQLSDQCLHYQSFSAGWTRSTLFVILSSLFRVSSTCHSQQSYQGLHYLPFSETVWSVSTLFAILSRLIDTLCHSQSYLGLHYLPVSVWKGSRLYAILSSLIRVYTTYHSL